MTATLINGTKIGEDIKAEVAQEVKELQAKGIQPGLSVVLVGDDAASSAYVNMKARTCEQLGKPRAVRVLHGNATVPVGRLKTRNIAAIAGEADVIVAAIGRAAMVTRDFVKPGAVVVDVGTNKVSDRATVERLFGDDPAR